MPWLTLDMLRSSLEIQEVNTYMQSGLPGLATINAGNDLAALIRAENVGQVCESNLVLDMPNLGIIMPDMGMPMKSPHQKFTSFEGLGGVLFTNTQQRVLACLFGQPERSYFANELINLTGAGSGAVQRELKRLSESGLVTSEMRGNQRHFQANPNSPIFQELTQIVQKTFGLAHPIREALAPYREAIRCAFIFGSIAKKQDTATSDIDLLVISDTLTYSDLVNQLLGTEVRLGRSINTTIYTEADVQQRLRDGNAFLTRILEQPKIWMIGNESDIPA